MSGIGAAANTPSPTKQNVPQAAVAAPVSTPAPAAAPQAATQAPTGSAPASQAQANDAATTTNLPSSLSPTDTTAPGSSGAPVRVGLNSPTATPGLSDQGIAINQNPTNPGATLNNVPSAPSVPTGSGATAPNWDAYYQYYDQSGVNTAPGIYGAASQQPAAIMAATHGQENTPELQGYYQAFGLTPSLPNPGSSEAQYQDYYASNPNLSFTPQQQIQEEINNPSYVNPGSANANQDIGYNTANALPTNAAEWQAVMAANPITSPQFNTLYGDLSQTNNPLEQGFQSGFPTQIQAAQTAQNQLASFLTPETNQLNADYQNELSAYNQSVQEMQALGYAAPTSPSAPPSLASAMSAFNPSNPIISGIENAVTGDVNNAGAYNTNYGSYITQYDQAQAAQKAAYYQQVDAQAAQQQAQAAAVGAMIMRAVAQENADTNAANTAAQQESAATVAALAARTKAASAQPMVYPWGPGGTAIPAANFIGSTAPLTAAMVAAPATAGVSGLSAGNNPGYGSAGGVGGQPDPYIGTGFYNPAYDEPQLAQEYQQIYGSYAPYALGLGGNGGDALSIGSDLGAEASSAGGGAVGDIPDSPGTQEGPTNTGDLAFGGPIPTTDTTPPPDINTTDPLSGVSTMPAATGVGNAPDATIDPNAGDINTTDPLSGVSTMPAGQQPEISSLPAAPTTPVTNTPLSPASPAPNSVAPATQAPNSVPSLAMPSLDAPVSSWENYFAGGGAFPGSVSYQEGLLSSMTPQQIAAKPNLAGFEQEFGTPIDYPGITGQSPAVPAQIPTPASAPSAGQQTADNFIAGLGGNYNLGSIVQGLTGYSPGLQSFSGINTNATIDPTHPLMSQLLADGMTAAQVNDGLAQAGITMQQLEAAANPQSYGPTSDNTGTLTTGTATNPDLSSVGQPYNPAATVATVPGGSLTATNPTFANVSPPVPPAEIAQSNDITNAAFQSALAQNPDMSQGALPDSTVLQYAANLVSGGGGASQVASFIKAMGYNVDTQFCGDFAAAIQTAMGNQTPTNPAAAANWNAWTALKGNTGGQPGDVVVVENTSSSTGMTGSHVMTIQSYNPTTNTYQIISGNNNAVLTMTPAQLTAANMSVRSNPANSPTGQ